jgi:hypothetical protein
VSSSGGVELERVLRPAARVLLGIALVGAIVPGVIGTGVAVGAVSLVLAVPILRVCWLGVAWAREGDRRFAALAVALVTLMAVGAILAALGVGD